MAAITLYAYATPDGLLLAEMEKPDPSHPMIIGAIIPGVDGNYYKEILVSGVRDENELEFTLGAAGWLKWLKTDALPEGAAVISDEFPFDPEQVAIIALNGEVPGLPDDKVSLIKSKIEEWAAKQGHDRCWYYPDIFVEIARIVGADVQPQSLPPREEFEEGCRRYQAEEYGDKT